MECGCELWRKKPIDIKKRDFWVVEDATGDFVKLRCVRERATYKTGSEAPMCREHMKNWQLLALDGLELDEDPEEAAEQWVERHLEPVGA